MKSSILKLMEKDKTKNIGVTIRESTFRRIERYKEKNKIKQLSPFIDALITDWLNQQEKKE